MNSLTDGYINNRNIFYEVSKGYETDTVNAVLFLQQSNRIRWVK